MTEEQARHQVAIKEIEEMYKADSAKKDSILAELEKLPGKELTEFLSKKAGFSMDQLMKLASDAEKLRASRAAEASSEESTKPKTLPIRAVGPYLEEGDKKIALMVKYSLTYSDDEIKQRYVSRTSVAHCDVS